MATGGAIICAQYLGSNQKGKANQALKQLIFSVTLISILITLPCILFRRPLLSLIFGSEKKRDGQFVKLSFHNSPILSLYRSI